MQANYPACYAAVRVYEGGNDDDKRDPGGRTSRGVIQHEWDKFRKTHPGRPADVWLASEEDIAEIYRTNYWFAQALDAMFSGGDESLFDYGVNSGIGRSQKVLRRCLHLPDNAPRADVDKRIAALTPDQQKVLIKAINDERLAFLKSLKTWPTFGGGWGKRVVSVTALSLKLNASPGVPSPPTVPGQQAPESAPGKGQHAEPTKTKEVIKKGGATTSLGPLAWIQTHPVEALLIAAAIIGVVVGAIYLINRWHKARQEAPVAGWTPPAELAPV